MDESDEPYRPTGPLGGSTRLQAASSRALAAGLWAALALALVLGLVNWAQQPVSVTAPDTAGGAPPPVAPPGGCAELAVSAWVAGDADVLDGATVAAGTPPDTDRRAVRTYTVDVTAADSSDRWGYLVAARVQERDRDSGQWHDLGLQYLNVTMVATDGGCRGWSPVAPPMQVTAPALAAAVPPPYPVVLSVSGSGLGATLEAFFTGMLTGAGDLERYLAPGASVPAVTPTPYREVGVSEVRAPAGAPLARGDEVPPDGTTVPLLVNVTTDRTPLPLTYPVTVGVRGGRWEVVAISPVVPASPHATTEQPHGGDQAATHHDPDAEGGQEQQLSPATTEPAVGRGHREAALTDPDQQQKAPTEQQHRPPHGADPDPVAVGRAGRVMGGQVRTGGVRALHGDRPPLFPFERPPP